MVLNCSLRRARRQLGHPCTLPRSFPPPLLLQALEEQSASLDGERCSLQEELTLERARTAELATDTEALRAKLEEVGARLRDEVRQMGVRGGAERARS